MVTLVLLEGLRQFGSLAGKAASGAVERFFRCEGESGILEDIQRLAVETQEKVKLVEATVSAPAPSHCPPCPELHCPALPEPAPITSVAEETHLDTAVGACGGVLAGLAIGALTWRRHDEGDEVVAAGARHEGYEGDATSGSQAGDVVGPRRRGGGILC